LEVKGKKIIVVGLGISGLWAARWACRLGARVTVSEMRRAEEMDPSLLEELEELGARFEGGGHDERSFLGADLVIVSPGVPADLPALRAAGDRGIPVLGELEVASRFVKAPIIAVTGSNGKSTVTSLLGDILKASGRKVFVGGNIGTPLISLAASPEPVDLVVVEVSSFQLDTTRTFSPHISILLNISPDHLDRYEGFEAYVRSKYRIFMNQGRGDYLILNDDDTRLKALSPATRAAVLRYGLEPGQGRDAFCRGEEIVMLRKGRTAAVCSVSDFSLPGDHNLGNLMAAVLAARQVGVAPHDIQAAVSSFKGLPHRMEEVAEIGGVRFFNDSKATNVDAAVKAVTGLGLPIVLIAGGRHKGADYAELTEAACGRVKGAVLLGEAREIMAASFQGKIPVRMARDMEQAVAMAHAWASPGEAVLLSPACASFDMFESYAHRGRLFREAVTRLRDGTGQKRPARGL